MLLSLLVPFAEQPATFASFVPLSNAASTSGCSASYEDGDREDLTFHELRKILLPEKRRMKQEPIGRSPIRCEALGY